MNPFRYRSYYYDTETKFYYLQTRYYDPETGRFISQDDVSYLDPESINGLNLYAYCGDNPVMRTDSTGTMPKWLQWTLGITIIVAAIAVSIATAGLAAPIAGAFGLSGLAGAIVGGAAAGAIGGAIAGFGISVGMQGIASGFDNINWSQVGKDALIGAISGFVSAGVFGGIKYAMSATKIANSLSKLSQATSKFDEAALALKSTDSFVGVFKGGSMATRTVAHYSYEIAQRALNSAKNINAIIEFSATQGYGLAQLGLKQLVGYGIGEWFKWKN